MDIKQLKYLIALDQTRHFGQAAAACHITQPTLSMRIRNLEEELDLSGVPFDPPIYLDLCVAWRRGDPLSMANRALRDFLLKERPT